MSIMINIKKLNMPATKRKELQTSTKTLMDVFDSKNTAKVRITRSKFSFTSKEQTWPNILRHLQPGAAYKTTMQATINGMYALFVDATSSARKTIDDIIFTSGYDGPSNDPDIIKALHIAQVYDNFSKKIPSKLKGHYMSTPKSENFCYDNIKLSSNAINTIVKNAETEINQILGVNEQSKNINNKFDEIRDILNTTDKRLTDFKKLLLFEDEETEAQRTNVKQTQQAVKEKHAELQAIKTKADKALKEIEPLLVFDQKLKNGIEIINRQFDTKVATPWIILLAQCKEFQEVFTRDYTKFKEDSKKISSSTDLKKFVTDTTQELDALKASIIDMLKKSKFYPESGFNVFKKIKDAFKTNPDVINNCFDELIKKQQQINGTQRKKIKESVDENFAKKHSFRINDFSKAYIFDNNMGVPLEKAFDKSYYDHEFGFNLTNQCGIAQACAEIVDIQTLKTSPVNEQYDHVAATEIIYKGPYFMLITKNGKGGKQISGPPKTINTTGSKDHKRAEKEVHFYLIESLKAGKWLTQKELNKIKK